MTLTCNIAAVRQLTFCLVMCASYLCVGAFETSQYSVINNGSLCLKSTFVFNYSAVTQNSQCAVMCSFQQGCQAFTTNDGFCQLFVFGRCSKYVRDCNCARRGQVFVKQQPGLQLPGALCPSGYADDLCGVKYKLYVNTGTWSASRQKCESETGLVIMADVVDAAEMTHVEAIYAKYNAGGIWLGGYQRPGSAEPAGGWYWVACNITLDGSLWGPGLNNYNNSENAVSRFTSDSKLNDLHENIAGNVLCECVSPFD